MLYNLTNYRPENLIIPDDPGFLPDDIIPDPNIDLSMFDSSVVSSSIPSILSGGAGASSGSHGSVIGIELPSSVSGDIQEAAAQLISEPISNIGIGLEDDEGFDPNIGFGFDEDGNLLDFPPLAEEVELPPLRARSDSQISARARLAFEQDLLGQHAAPDAEFSLVGNDHAELLPEAEPFPTGQYGPGDGSVVPRTARARRPIPIDKTLQLRHSDLANMNDNYLSNMAAAKKLKNQYKSARLARKNAFHYVFGCGLGNTGLPHGNLTGPLAQFSGTSLYESLTGLEFNAPAPILGKRPSSPDAEQSVNKRARPEVGRGPEDEAGDMLPLFDDSVELAREAPLQSLYDEHSSQMPWNHPPSSRATSRHASIQRSAAGNSARPPRSFDRAGTMKGHQAQMPSSPLHGRGPLQASAFLETPGGELLGDESGFEDQIQPMSGLDASPEGGFNLPASSPSQPMPWSRTLDADARRFLSFVSANANPVAPSDTSEEVVKETMLSSLLPPTEHSRLVAVQAFVHLLTLANEGCIIAKQDTAADENDIWLGVKKGYEGLEPETMTALEADVIDVGGPELVLGEEEKKEAEKGHDNEDDDDNDDRSEGKQAAAIARLRF